MTGEPIKLKLERGKSVAPIRALEREKSEIAKQEGVETRREGSKSI